mmetsp:Transcript_8870/g.20318  ORF Transcript_8870/g.20318 Transcript_8870/m.20318 type:complete len:238 (-) Transcript_8870:558-1271(-)
MRCLRDSLAAADSRPKQAPKPSHPVPTKARTHSEDPTPLLRLRPSGLSHPRTSPLRCRYHHQQARPPRRTVIHTGLLAEAPKQMAVQTLVGPVALRGTSRCPAPSPQEWPPRAGAGRRQQEVCHTEDHCGRSVLAKWLKALSGKARPHPPLLLRSRWDRHELARVLDQAPPHHHRCTDCGTLPRHCYRRPSGRGQHHARARGPQFHPRQLRLGPWLRCGNRCHRLAECEISSEEKAP